MNDGLLGRRVVVLILAAMLVALAVNAIGGSSLPKGPSIKFTLKRNGKKKNDETEEVTESEEPTQ